MQWVARAPTRWKRCPARRPPESVKHGFPPGIAQRFQNFQSRRVGMAGVGGPFQSGHGPAERAGVLNFVSRARANLAGGNPGFHPRRKALLG